MDPTLLAGLSNAGLASRFLRQQECRRTLVSGFLNRRAAASGSDMYRIIKTLFNFDAPATDKEIRVSAPKGRSTEAEKSRAGS